MTSAPGGREPAAGRRTAWRNVVERLRPGEAAGVLDALLERHPELEAEAAALAEDLLTSVDAHVLAEDVSEAALAVDLDELDNRAGRQPWGYVEPTEAAWEVLDETVEPYFEDMQRLLDLGFEAAAVEVCRGIVLGLYELRDAEADVLGWAPDFPLEAAGRAVSELVAALDAGSPGRDALRALGDEAPAWADALARAAVARR